MNSSPLPFKFSTTFKVRYAETDLQRHVFFWNYLVYFDEALMEYLDALGFGYPVIGPLGLDWVYVDAHTAYKGSAVLADILRTHVRIAQIGNSSIKAEFQVFKEGTGELITTGDLTFVVVDLKTRSPLRAPDFFREAVAMYQASS